MEQKAISNVFLKKIVCLSVCLTFFERADARDLGLMTLFKLGLGVGLGLGLGIVLGLRLGTRLALGLRVGWVLCITTRSYSN